MQEPNVAAPPHGLMGLEKAPELWQEPWAWVLAGFIILSGILAYTYWRRRVPKEAAPVRDPWQGLFARIDSLGEVSGKRPEEVQAYYGELSCLFREALEQRYGFGATGQTLEELRKSLQKLPDVPPELQKDWLGFLEEADRIKFAEGLRGSADHRSWQRQIGTWIRQWSKGA